MSNVQSKIYLFFVIAKKRKGRRNFNLSLSSTVFITAIRLILGGFIIAFASTFFAYTLIIQLHFVYNITLYTSLSR